MSLVLLLRQSPVCLWWSVLESLTRCLCSVGSSDIDECATQMHYCQSNTACVNLPGSHRCDCLPGFIRVDEYSCTGTWSIRFYDTTVTHTHQWHTLNSQCNMSIRREGGLNKDVLRSLDKWTLMICFFGGMCRCVALFLNSGEFLKLLVLD